MENGILPHPRHLEVQLNTLDEQLFQHYTVMLPWQLTQPGSWHDWRFYLHFCELYVL